MSCTIFKYLVYILKYGKLMRTCISTLGLGGCVIAWSRRMDSSACYGGLTAKTLRRRFDARISGGTCINTAPCVGY
jgi:hypothetical protein